MITAQEFSQAFERVTRNQISTLLDCWPKQSKFTNYVSQKMMPEIANSMGCVLELEHSFGSQRIDYAFRKRVGAALTSTVNPVVVAVEHENNFGKSHEEMTKLRDFHAPLGVLITFARPERRQEFTQKFADVLADASYGGSIIQQGEYLMIYGPYGFNPPVPLERVRHFGWLASVLSVCPLASLIPVMSPMTNGPSSPLT